MKSIFKLLIGIVVIFNACTSNAATLENSWTFTSVPYNLTYIPGSPGTPSFPELGTELTLTLIIKDSEVDFTGWQEATSLQKIQWIATSGDSTWVSGHADWNYQNISLNFDNGEIIDWSVRINFCSDNCVLIQTTWDYFESGAVVELEDRGKFAYVFGAPAGTWEYSGQKLFETITTPIPEPSNLAMLGLGLSVLGFAFNFRRKS